MWYGGLTSVCVNICISVTNINILNKQTPYHYLSNKYKMSFLINICHAPVDYFQFLSIVSPFCAFYSQSCNKSLPVLPVNIFMNIFMKLRSPINYYISQSICFIRYS